MDQASKLKKFEAAVLAEINTKTDLIKHEAQEFKKSELEKNSDTQLLKSYNEIQKQSQDMKKKFKREVAKFGLDAKRRVLIKRSDITKQVFDSVTARLLEFYNSEAYNEYLLRKLSNFAAKNPMPEVEILVSERDFLNAEKLKAAYTLPCTFTQDKSIKLGGFIVKDVKNNRHFDETLTNILAEQKGYFIQNSALFL